MSGIVRIDVNSDFQPIPKGFFAYPSNPPAIPPTLTAAIEAINRTQQATLTSWEDLHIGGTYIIDSILSAINEADFFCADVTGVNPNVMFELGFAIATDKRIWLVRDESYVDVRKEFDQLRILTTIGFRPYTNSDQVIKGFFNDRPDQNLKETIWSSTIEPVLAKESTNRGILYLKNFYESEASIKITRAVEQSRLECVVSDPRETTVRPAYWFAQQLFDSPGLIAHFTGPQREGGKLNNAKYAFVCGMARGFGVPVLMLAEQGSLLAPIDYRDLLQMYITPAEAYEHAIVWLGPRTTEGFVLEEVHANRAKALKLATELKDFHTQLGEYVAEDEANRLNEYFLETTVSDDIANGTQTVFVGRKGCGKSANLIHAESTLGMDPRNLICTIRPLGYEIEGLVRLFNSYKFRDTKGYVIESLWKFMLYTELAQAAVRQIGTTEVWRLTEPDVAALVEIVDDEKQVFMGDFAIRLERLVGRLETVAGQDSAEQFRNGISEAVHSVALSKLRIVLGKFLSTKNKVYLLVDNLDRSWTKDSDLKQLAELF